VSDIDIAVVDSLKVLDPKWPIREADIAQCSRHVSKVPISEVNDSFDHLVGVRQHAGGTVMPSAFAVLRLIMKVSLLACSIGRSPGLVPARFRDIGARMAKAVHEVAG
jgi:hypothetical protein